MPDQVMMHRQRAMPELRALHQRLRLRKPAFDEKGDHFSPYAHYRVAFPARGNEHPCCVPLYTLLTQAGRPTCRECG